MLYILTYSVPEYFFNQYVGVFQQPPTLKAINKLLEESGIGQLDEKSFNTLIDDYYVESFTGSYLKITHDTFADWLGK